MDGSPKFLSVRAGKQKAYKIKTISSEMSPPKAKKSKKSVVWKFYEDPGSPNVAKVNCPACEDDIVYSGTTSGLKSHLITQHPGQYRKILENQKENNGESPRSSSEAEKYLAHSFATSLVPFRFAENYEFKKFLEVMPQNFAIPSAEKIKKLINTEAENYNSHLRSKFDKIGKFTLMTDGYSQYRRDYHFYSVHIAYTDLNFGRHLTFVALNTVESKNETGISSAVCEILQKCGLQFSNCSVLMADGASPLALLADKHQIDRIHCACHQLNLVIKDFATTKEVANCQMRAETFARHLSRNSDDKRDLKMMAESQGIRSPLPLPLPETRWAGLYLLLQRFVIFYPAISNITSLQKFLVKSVQLERMKEIVNLLAPVYETILKLERDKSVTSEILPSFVYLVFQVKKIKSSLSDTLAQHLEKRKTDCLKNRRLLCAVLMDPRFAFVDIWIDPISWEDVEKDIVKYDTIPAPGLCSSPSSSNSDMSFETFVKDRSFSGSVNQDDLKAELIRYRALLATNRPSIEDPLQFWRVQAVNFPRLCGIAKELLSSPASSSASERCFSRCTDFIRQTKRNRSKLETLSSVLTVSEMCKLRREESDETKEDCDDDWDEDEEEEGEDSGTYQNAGPSDSDNL